MHGVSRQPLLSDKNRNDWIDNNYFTAIFIHAKRIDPHEFINTEAYAVNIVRISPNALQKHDSYEENYARDLRRKETG